MYIIYMHTLPNGKSYIGQTSRSLQKRVRKGFTGYNSCPFFSNAVKKHGAENVRTEILYRCETLDEANRIETLCIARYNTLAPHGYNLMTGGGSNGKHSEETLKKISDALSGENSPRYGKPPLNGMLGKKHSDESRDKIRVANTGRKVSRATRQRMSEAQRARYKRERENL